MVTPESVAPSQERKEVEKLKSDLEMLRTDLAQLTDTFKRTTRQQINKGAEHARESADHLRSQAEEAAHNLEREIGARPLTSVLTALGVGFLVGRLLGR